MPNPPILDYQPGAGLGNGSSITGQRNGYLYYWPDIENLTGTVPQTDLEAQDISILPPDSLIIVVTGVDGDETHWRRVQDFTSPVTDLGTGIIVPINYDAETRPWVLEQELTGAGVGTNAFGTVAVGATNIVADLAPDTLTLVAGTNITLTPDAFADSVTIAASGGAGGTSMSSPVTQTIHGLAVGNVVRYTGTSYVKAQADVAANAEVVGLVSAVADANNFTLTTGGVVSGLSGLTPGSVYFLSTSTAGLLTTTAPTVTNQVSKPLMIATSATAGYFFNWRGWIVGNPVAGGGGGGNVSNSGTPTVDQTAVWTDATHIQGVTTLKGGTTGQILKKNTNTDYDWVWGTAGGTGTVTDFSAGDLSPLFTTTEATTTTTPALSFALTNAAASTVFGRAAGTSGAPTYSSSPQFTAIGNLTTNGFVKTTAGTGTLSIDTNTYLTSFSPTVTFRGDAIYTILSTDRYVATNAAMTTARQWTMPLANSVTAGTSIIIHDMFDALTATNRIFLVRSGTDTFNPGGSTQINMTQNGQAIQFTSDGGTKWHVVNLTAGTATTNGQVLAWDNGSKAWNLPPNYLAALSTTNVAGQIMQYDGGTAIIASAMTWPSGAAPTSGKIVVSNGTNMVASTPTFPNASATSGKLIQSDGTNWIASTPTWPTAIAQGDLVYGSATSTVIALAKNTTATRYLANTGTTNNPQWDLVNLANGTTGTLPNASLTGSGAITIAGTSTALGGSISQDTITGLGSTGIVKRTAANTLGIATAKTDYWDTTDFTNSAHGLVPSPASSGTTTRYLREDATWVVPPGGAGGSPGGSNTYVQFNDSGAFGGDAGMTYTKSIPKLALSGAATSDSRFTVGSLEFQPYGLNNVWFGDNAYYDGSGFKYRTTGSAGLFYFAGTEGQFRFSVSGTGGTALPSQAAQLKVNTDGTVAIGGQGSNAAGTYTNSLLLVKGATAQIGIASNYELGWASTSNDASGSIDAGLARSTTGVLEINNGTTGQYAGLRAGARDAATNTLLDVITLYRQTTGSPPAAGLGPAIIFRADDNGVASQTQARVHAAWSDATDANRTAYMNFQLPSLGTFTDRMRLHGSGGLSVGHTTDPSAGIISANTGYWVGTAASTSGKILISDGAAFKASTATFPSTATNAGYEVRTDGTNVVAYPDGLSASSTASVSSAYAADTYLAGSMITVAAGDWKAQGQYRCEFDMTKTAAGTATPIISVRMGTAGTTADTAVATITFGAPASGAVDTGIFTVYVTFRTVGSGTSAVIQATGKCDHHVSGGGLTSTGAGTTGIITTTSAGFNSTTQTKIGLSFNGGTSFVGSNNFVQSTLRQP